MRPAITRLALATGALLALSGCGDPLRLVLVEAVGGLAPGGGGSETGGSSVGGSDSISGSGGSAGTGALAGSAGAFDGPPWEAPTLYTASYSSLALPGQYIHQVETEGFVGAIDLNSVAAKDAATFQIITGVWDDECISFRAVDQVGALFRHAGSRLYMHPANNEPLFLADATYCIEPGLADSAGFSFRSVNYPQRVIHMRPDGSLWTDYIEYDSVDVAGVDDKVTEAFAVASTFYREMALNER